jgi:hypothetical protein
MTIDESRTIICLFFGCFYSCSLVLVSQHYSFQQIDQLHNFALIFWIFFFNHQNGSALFVQKCD